MKKILLTIAIAVTSVFCPMIEAQTKVPNDELCPIIISLVEEGMTVSFSPGGISMRPFIYEGDVVHLEKIQTIHVGDIVMAHISPSRYVLHRVIDYSDSIVTLMGDGNIRGQEYCHPDSIKVKCTARIKANGDSIFFDTDIQQSRAELWRTSLAQREQLMSSTSSEPDSAFWSGVFLKYLSTGDRGMTIRAGYELRALNHTPVSYLLLKKQDTKVDLNKLITFNETAGFLYFKMQKRCVNVQDLVHELTEDYNVDTATATKDCYKTLLKWFNLGLIKFCF